jgi:hypothetical protein
MRIITIQRPWAGLITTGAKSVELRSWSTTYRGPLAIHAGASFDKRGSRHVETGKRGHVLCVVNLVDVRPATVADMPLAGIELDPAGLFAWVLANPRRIKEQPMKGALGLRHAPDWISAAAV